MQSYSGPSRQRETRKHIDNHIHVQLNMRELQTRATMECALQPNPDPEDNSLRVGVVTLKNLESKLKVSQGIKLAIGVEISLHWPGLHSKLRQTRLYKVF